MTKSLRLTKRAESSLTAIATWTIDNFGPLQADAYEAELLSRCDDLINGRAHSRSCAVLVDGAQDLRYIRAGEHFVVYVESNLTVTIIDILHSRCDLPRHIAALSSL